MLSFVQMGDITDTLTPARKRALIMHRYLLPLLFIFYG